MRKFIILTIIFTMIAGLSFAQEEESNVIITLENGSNIQGSIQKRDNDNIYLIDTNGEERVISKREILEIKNINQEQEAYSGENNKTQFKETEEESGEYFTFGVGYGNSYGGMGLRLQYNFGNTALHGGTGYFPASAALDYDFVENPFLFDIGMKVYLNNDQTFYLNPHYGSFGVKAIKTYGLGEDQTYQNVMHGPSLLLGVDFFFGETFGLNAGIGASYNTVDDEWDDLFDRNVKYWFALDIGLLFR